jgi:hypothetical protein
VRFFEKRNLLPMVARASPMTFMKILNRPLSFISHFMVLGILNDIHSYPLDAVEWVAPFQKSQPTPVSGSSLNDDLYGRSETGHCHFFCIS